MRLYGVSKRVVFVLSLVLSVTGITFDGVAADWPGWRGPQQNGVSLETGLISTWSQTGDNLIWKAPFMGRSTPIVLNGRVYVIGRVGDNITEQERVACYDAGTGALIWEHLFNAFHTTIPFNRVGWANLVGDPETGNIYAHGIAGLFICYDRDGNILWSHSLTEEYGRISGYGGRTNTPVVDGDLVILSFLNTSWGSQVVPRHRFFAFDKRTGQVVWTSMPGNKPLDTTYSTPVIAVINGQRLLIGGNADGWIYALKVQTGEKVWGFHLSKRGINVSVVVEGTRVYAAHSEENIDNTVLGRVVCIDGAGTGDITATHEIWRYDGCFAGYTSPVIHAGRLYIVDNSANIHCLDAGNGQLYWEQNIGTVGKGSLVWADGKLYTTEVNGGFQILRPSAHEAVVLDEQRITTAGGRTAELYGSPAIAYGRVYFMTEESLYCLGDDSQPFVVSSSPARPAPAQAQNPDAAPVSLQVVPADVVLTPSESVTFTVRAFDADGRFLREVDAEWTSSDLIGQFGESGQWTPDAGQGAQAGMLTVQVEGLQSSARVRVIPPLPWSEDFETVMEGKNPSHWVGASIKFIGHTKDGRRVLMKPPVQAGLNGGSVYIGPPDMQGYTIQADMMGTRNRRNRSDMGLVSHRYTMRLLGNHQQLQIYSWASDLRMARAIDFPWDIDVWYTMKMRVEVLDNMAVIHGKVWPAGTPEPDAWSITAEDPRPNRTGSPGLYGYSVAPVYYDNVTVQ